MDWQRVEAVFMEAAGLPAQDRAGYLAEACADDEGLRAEVEKLLGLDAAAGSFLEGQALEVRRDVGLVVGAYRLERMLGRGGMGTVYLGVREEGETRHEAAVKLLARGVSAEAMWRFRHERQVLAGLDHPGIGRLYDWGTAEDGRPYLVMEHVEGQPIDAYCESRNLELEARLRLVQQVCAAVGEAHRRLVVHRDLKPSNILVTEQGAVKVIDFGIAKSLEGQGETRTGQRVMTPAYASPEQVRGGVISTASDIYSLGVVLYELLAGRRPYHLVDSDDYTLQLAIVEQEAPRPSSRAAREGQAALSRRLRGDLDAIVLKALRKEPEGRYGTMEALAADLERHLVDEPVMARSGARLYRIGKFVRRHRLAIATAAVFVLSVALFVAGLVQQTTKANRESAKARQALGLLVEAFKASDPETARGREITAREVLDGAAPKVRATADIDVRATLLSAMGEVYTSLGAFDEAETVLTEALELRRSMGPREHGQALYLLGELAWHRRDFGEAEKLFSAALEHLPVGDVASGRSLRGRGLARVWLGEVEAGEVDLRAAEALLGAEFDENEPERLRITQGLGWAARERGDYAAAAAFFGELVAARRPGGAGPALGRALADLGDIHYRRGKLREARSLHVEALPMLRESMGPKNPYVAEDLGKLVPVLMRLEEHTAAQAAIEEILAILPAVHPGRATALHNRAAIFIGRGDLTSAERSAREALEVKRKLFDGSDERVGLAWCLLGRIALLKGEALKAKAHFEACARIFPEGHPQRAFPLLGIGEAVELLEGCAAALPWYRQALEFGREKLGSEHFQTDRAAERLEACLGD